MVELGLPIIVVILTRKVNMILRQMLFMVTPSVDNRAFYRQMCFSSPNQVYLAHIAKNAAFPTFCHGH